MRTLGGRIFAAVAATLAVLFLVGALLAESRIRAFGRTEVERRLAAVAALLEARCLPALGGTADPAAFAREIRALRLEGGTRLTVIAADGTVLGDNVADPPLENHAARPEVLEAGRAGTGSDARRSASTGWDTLYFARAVRDGGRVAGYVRVAEPLDGARAEVASIRAALLAGGAAVLLLGLAFSGLLARRIARPLREMERTAARIAGGEWADHVEADGPEEVARLAGSLNRMAGQIRARVEAEEAARAQLEAVLAGMVEGVVAVDPAERVLFMNAAAARLLSLPGPLAPGGSLWEALRHPALEDALRAALRGGTPGRTDAPSPGRDGRVLEISAGPLGAGGGAVVLLRDVTEVRRLERIRMDFVANVSHELRTPLSGIAGALETLEGDDLDAGERRRFLDIARRNADRLRSLVADLLDLSAIESEGTAMALEPMPADRPLRAAVAALAEMSSRNGVPVAVEVPAPVPVVAANARRLEQAFVNLLENALKYTPSGGRIAARVLDRGAEVAVEIADTGAGIPAGALPRIFERFFRADPSRSRQMGGTGLGLAIVKHVVLAHRGRVEVRSEEGAGSVFTVILPAVRAA